MQKENFSWPDGKKAAVSLTYDDALPVHRTLVADVLERNGLTGTFYAPIRSQDLITNPEAWRKVASKGHELGNHSIFHPCRDSERHKWLKECYDLKNYTADQLHNELEVANFALRLIDGKAVRSYGNTCCNTTIGKGANEESMDAVLTQLFPAARGTLNDTIFNPRETFNPMQIGHFSGDAKTFIQIKTDIEKAVEQGGWIVYMIHGVGEGTHSLYMEEDEHTQLIEWLAKNRNHIWTKPFADIANYVINDEMP
ncbi:polysaccharide deacetylase family protein [Rubellicoccus peritrichatus]|uniref:Polysaccharide deacetylase family protein n=1 Tax=Rubellicoccus peritrichatus TaxID=3080537 RepID=A0AAQ3L986_9BACT|nr:polysaccharide deacetylase family protein [Puniceicoccus sp. CR14]WOO41705.1 polysaccharide deacetylase family protein [Puniceicoccus sp. CR14]